MQSKKENGMHWKDKLEEAGNFPYAPAGKELAWQKLSSRLGQKKKRKKTVWYWAAACLLPALLFGLFTYTHQREVVVKTIPHTSAAKPSITTTPVPEETTVIASAHAQKTKDKEAIQKSITVKTSDTEKDTPLDSAITDHIVVAVEPIDSTSTMASVIQPQKKKLKVVHINELNEPFESTPVVAHVIYHPRFLPLHIAVEPVFPQPLKTIHSTGFISLKSRSSNQ